MLFLSIIKKFSDFKDKEKIKESSKFFDLNEGS
jgi:hypothetical protein